MYWPEVDYKPATIEDSSYQGLADGDAPRSRIHGRISEKAVAFEGTKTGRRFFACSQHNVSILIY
jgi:hypothetical protein